MAKAERWEPSTDILPYFPEISGNTVNGLGESDRRPPSPFFWHEPALQTHGELQGYVTSKFYDTPEVTESFSRDPVTHVLRKGGPDQVPVAQERIEPRAPEWTQAVTEFAPAKEADLIG